MPTFPQLFLVFALSMLPSSAVATECDLRDACVPPDEMETFLGALKEKQCLLTTTPTLDLTEVTIVTDKDGRVYYLGSGAVPFGARLTWCTYTVEFEGELKVVVAKQPTPVWGWHFRLKAAFGYLPVEAFTTKNAMRGLDGGLLFEPFFYRWVNANGYVGARSVGAGLGFDLTNNVTWYAGYAISYVYWRSGPYLAVAFDLW